MSNDDNVSVQSVSNDKNYNAIVNDPSRDTFDYDVTDIIETAIKKANKPLLIQMAIIQKTLDKE